MEGFGGSALTRRVRLAISMAPGSRRTEVTQHPLSSSVAAVAGSVLWATGSASTRWLPVVSEPKFLQRFTRAGAHSCSEKHDARGSSVNRLQGIAKSCDRPAMARPWRAEWRSACAAAETESDDHSSVSSVVTTRSLCTAGVRSRWRPGLLTTVYYHVRIFFSPH